MWKTTRFRSKVMNWKRSSTVARPPLKERNTWSDEKNVNQNKTCEEICQKWEMLWIWLESIIVRWTLRFRIAIDVRQRIQQKSLHRRRKNIFLQLKSYYESLWSSSQSSHRLRFLRQRLRGHLSPRWLQSHQSLRLYSRQRLPLHSAGSYGFFHRYNYADGVACFSFLGGQNVMVMAVRAFGRHLPVPEILPRSTCWLPPKLSTGNTGVEGAVSGAFSI